MSFTPHGKHLIAGEWVAGEATFRSEPAHGLAHDFAVGTPALVDRACEAAEAASRFMDNAPGNVYSRFTNPTVRAFAERLAALEGAQWALATASGMSAIQMVAQSLLKAAMNAVLGATMVVGAVFIGVNLLSDLLYKLLDPRAR